MSYYTNKRNFNSRNVSYSTLFTFPLIPKPVFVSPQHVINYYGHNPTLRHTGTTIKKVQELWAFIFRNAFADHLPSHISTTL